jgi:hypothetical protein
MPRTGRPRSAPTIPVTLALRPATIAHIRAIGEREGLLHSGMPAPSKVVTWLVERDRDINRKPQP